MKALSMYVWSLLVIMMMGFTSCGDDDELQFSEEQLAYINKNKEYIWEKKAEKESIAIPKKASMSLPLPGARGRGWA